MRRIEEIGICPQCSCSISIFKTNSYKRFAKCEVCEMSYALPKRGKISSSGLICPRQKVPILIVEKPSQKAYFWADQPCFTCIDADKCEQTSELVSEFKGLQVYGY
ncbi:MAG TPA: hypothetical protein ENI29_12265 [bacterium]|nr:hypothetical protein [bacterium]